MTATTIDQINGFSGSTGQRCNASEANATNTSSLGFGGTYLTV